MLEYESISETEATDATGTMLGVRVRLVEEITEGAREEWVRKVKRLGEHIARARGSRYGRVWVWIWGQDMDPKGPAISSSYIEEGGRPATEFTPFALMASYYLGKMAKLDPVRIADRLRESGADEERIAAVVASIGAGD